MHLKKLILTSLFLAAAVVINRFLSFNSAIISIGFTFVPLMLGAIILGLKRSILIATLADIIGALLFPFGAYFIGYTISALLNGVIFGLLLYQKEEFKVDKNFISKLVFAILLNTIVVNGLLNTIWTFMTVDSATIAIIPTRFVKQVIMIPIMIITMIGITKLLEKEINVMKND